MKAVADNIMKELYCSYRKEQGAQRDKKTQWSEISRHLKDKKTKVKGIVDRGDFGCPFAFVVFNGDIMYAVIVA